jgi:hypothetical protein
MKKANRQHTVEFWYHPIQGHLVMVFTYKDWYWRDYCDNAEGHYRLMSKWGLIHAIFFGGIVPDKSIAQTLVDAVIDGRVKHVRFDDFINGKCDIRGNATATP